jgi:hypothetical protein
MDTNRIIKIEELKIGDEIIVPSNGGFRYFRVLRKPMINKKTNRYAAVRCSTNIEIEHLTRHWGKILDYTKEKYICTPEGHNTEKSVNFRWKTMWLVKRKGM